MKLFPIIAAVILSGCSATSEPAASPDDVAMYGNFNVAVQFPTEDKASPELETGQSLLKEKDRAFAAYVAALKAYNDYQRAHHGQKPDAHINPFDLE